MVTRLAIVVALAAAASVGACTLLDDGPPSTSCKANTDCFRAQGETCNTQTHVCEVTADAGVDGP